MIQPTRQQATAVPIPAAIAGQNRPTLSVVALANHADETREAIRAETIHHGLAR